MYQVRSGSMRSLGVRQSRALKGVLQESSPRFVASRRLSSSWRFSALLRGAVLQRFERFVLAMTNASAAGLRPRRTVATLQTAAAPVAPQMSEEAASAPGRRALCIVGIVLCVLFIAGFIAHASMQSGRKHIVLDDEGLQASMITKAHSVQDVLDACGVALGEHDGVIPAAATPVADGMSIRVLRANRFSVQVDGQERDVMLLAGTVGDLLARAGTVLGPLDEVSPSINTQLAPGTPVVVTRVAYKVIEDEQAIPFRTTTKKDESLEIGKQKVEKSGKEGLKVIRTQVTYRNGEEVARVVIGEQVKAVPQNRIVLEGAKKAVVKTAAPKKTVKATPTPKPTPTPRPVVASKVTRTKGDAGEIVLGGKTYKYAEMLKMEVTAYTHSGRPTASGSWPKVGSVAVDRDLIPFGTKLYVPGYGIGVACDVGGFDGYQIDLFMETERECMKWGRKRGVSVYILD